MSAFESLERDESIEGSSDRSFGLVFSAFSILVACWPLISGGALRLWALVLGGLFLLLAVLYPTILSPLNRLAYALGKTDLVARDVKQLEACCKDQAEVKQLFSQLASVKK